LLIMIAMRRWLGMPRLLNVNTTISGIPPSVTGSAGWGLPLICNGLGFSVLAFDRLSGVGGIRLKDHP
jgi:hypothetical protein